MQICSWAGQHELRVGMPNTHCSQPEFVAESSQTTGATFPFRPISDEYQIQLTNHRQRKGPTAPPCDLSWCRPVPDSSPRTVPPRPVIFSNKTGSQQLDVGPLIRVKCSSDKVTDRSSAPLFEFHNLLISINYCLINKHLCFSRWEARQSRGEATGASCKYQMCLLFVIAPIQWNHP